MYKKTLAIILAILALHAQAMNSTIIIQADRAYLSGNLTLLGRIYSISSRDIIINYLYSKALLSKNIPTLANDFVNDTQDSYLREDLLHQLLLFYFNNQQYSNYLVDFKRLSFADTSLNEKCGADYAKVMINSAATRITNRNWLINNNIPLWCAKLIALDYRSGRVDVEQRNRLLYNLIINGKQDIFNAVSNDFAVREINFYRYQNYSVAHLPDNNDYPYLVVNRLAAIAHPYPEMALQELHAADLNSATERFLSNYVALQFALKQEFAIALKLFNKYADDNLSDEEQAWRVRSDMYFAKWHDVLANINAMPYALMHSDVWLYWAAIAYTHLGDISAANAKLSSIPNDYSYYALLSSSQLHHSTVFRSVSPIYHLPAKANDASLEQAQNILNTYQIAKSNNSNHLEMLMTNSWYYLVKHVSTENKLAMSLLAMRAHVYHLSIFAADDLPTWYLDLSFPMPFLSSYGKSSRLYGIDKSYPLAISRQESRFNYSVIAFDGGVGLMQIMPGTAAYIAHKLYMRNCYRSSPECNIRFGTWYLSNLLQKFNNNRIYATAAYNAGPHRARMWQDNLQSLDITLQIELIPIDITRSYVEKVLTNQAAYTSEFKQKNSIDLLSYINGISRAHYLNEPDDDNTDSSKLNQ